MSSIKDQIRAEVERLNNLNKQIAKEQGATDFIQGITAGYAEVLSFLDTLPEQPVEGLEEAAVAYSKQVSDGHNFRDLRIGFIAGAEWGISQGKEVKDAALKLCETVERYTNGAALRSELLNTVTQTRQKMR